MSLYRKFGKRALDVILASTALVVSMPVLVVVAALVRTKLGSPVLFRQVRSAKHARPFSVLKFRTMIDARDRQGRLLPDEDRLTPFGQFLRAYSLDELPQFWNVLRGEMSLIGPRPLVIEYVPRYTPEQARRHAVLPGITGWAQVNGRNSIGWQQKFELDAWYVDNLSLLLDLRILWRTGVTVITRQGISNEGHATMPEFTGKEMEG